MGHLSSAVPCSGILLVGPEDAAPHIRHSSAAVVAFFTERSQNAAALTMGRCSSPSPITRSCCISWTTARSRLIAAAAWQHGARLWALCRSGLPAGDTRQQGSRRDSGRFRLGNGRINHDRYRIDSRHSSYCARRCALVSSWSPRNQYLSRFFASPFMVSLFFLVYFLVGPLST